MHSTLVPNRSFVVSRDNAASAVQHSSRGSDLEGAHWPAPPVSVPVAEPVSAAMPATFAYSPGLIVRKWSHNHTESNPYSSAVCETTTISR
ncbi:hypothetical protein J113_05570 [Mycobacterium tuberculosis CAS/NITR204]|uniref:Uncharacterized protein n=1 Tax=Mycobacterium tuberculosis CAS/NITR204 TaxID=1310114 RepID=R4MAY4_MYCTX|nr:hypothetical protein J113_05570 [Mycobacterium tuberculosis CAS/NITR204]